MFRIDTKKRQLIITDNIQKTVIKGINEFDKIKKRFLPNTDEKYECELVLLDVEVGEDEKTKKKITKAFAKRIDYDNWLMEFNETDYIFKDEELAMIENEEKLNEEETNELTTNEISDII